MSLSNEISNLSYTNKDFNSIYIELLEYAKKLSYKWDPASSDESDPGVVLLKLAALIGDKDSYNIDKNVLELMPASVTQMPAARQLFDQCGYSMRYFRAAEDIINITIKKDLGDDLSSNSVYYYTVPRFTMFSDTDKSIVYTAVESASIPVKTEFPVKVMEGTVSNYTVNNDSLITIQNLDSNNRLYFSETNVAENGIFITNVDSNNSVYSNYEEWERVNNLQVQPKGKRCYRFGITLDNSVCYIEFPDDVELLVGEGLNISYILTSGSKGNVSAGKIRDFYADTKFTRTLAGSNSSTSVNVTSQDVSIKNPLPINSGEDPETIEDAYKNYKRVRDTFETLVSLKDYTDNMVTRGAASNGYVCDRTNDIQHSYRLLTSADNSTYVKSVVDRQLSNLYAIDKTTGNYVQLYEEKMNAFDLCVYALQYIPDVTSTSSFKTSFKIVSNNTSIFDDNSIYTSLQHNFKEFELDRMLMLKNKYMLTANIVPRYMLSSTEKLQVISNVEKALCQALNSNNISFGSEVSSELIQKTILNADERIKALIDFSSPKYQTFAVYKSRKDLKFHEMRVDYDSLNAGYVTSDYTYDNKTYTEKKEDLYYLDLDNMFKRAPSEYDPSIKTYYTYDEELGSLWLEFRTEIFAKNVLAGISPLYTDDNKYVSGVTQQNVKEYNDIQTISTKCTIQLNKSTALNRLESAELKENENILLTAPNLVKENNFSSYVKILYKLSSPKDISSDADYELRDDDYIVFFWKESDVSEDYTYVKYDSSSESLASVISPSGFTLKKEQDLTSSTGLIKDEDADADYIHKFFGSLEAGKGSTSGMTSEADKSFTKDTSKFGKITSATEFVKKCLINDSSERLQVLTGTKILNTKNVNEIHINNKDNGCSYLYWILNNVEDSQYTLFRGEDQTEYTLASGEYFLYTNDDKTALYILGEGTLIRRGGKWATDWSVPAIGYDELILKGIDILSDKWYHISKIDKTKYSEGITLKGVWATEQQQILIGPENKIVVYPLSNALPEDGICIDNVPTNLFNYSISYVDSKNNTTNIPIIAMKNTGWSAKSILNLNMSYDKPQKIHTNQKLYFDTTEVGDTEKVTYVQCNKLLNIVGGSNIPAKSLLSSNDSLSFMSFHLQESGLPEEYSSTVVLDIDPSTSKTEITTSLLSGKYLLQTIPSDFVSVDEITANNITIEKMANNIYALDVKSDASSVTLDISYNILKDAPKDSSHSITVLELYKYTDDLLKKIQHKNNTFNSDSTFEKNVLDKIKSLDLLSVYSYTHKNSTPVVNPLIATSFLKKDHFYNMYTICEWDTNVSDNVTIHDVIR